MMQGNESQRPDERDYKVFGLINDWVRLYPEQFIETGQFLDESYSEAEIRKRDAKERREDKKLGVPRDEIRKPSKLKTFSVATSDLLAQLGDVRIDRHDIGDSVEPWTEALGLHSGHKNFHDMRDEDKARIAKLVLLLTWLVTEPDADSFDVQITFLQYWPWDDGDACSTSDSKKTRASIDAGFHRCLARDILLKYNAEAWCELAQTSWSVICKSNDLETIHGRDQDDEINITDASESFKQEVNRPSDDSNLTLGEYQEICLLTLVDLKAINKKSAIPRAEVALKAFGLKTINRETMAGRALKGLRKKKLARSSKGRSATWFATQQGVDAAKALTT